MAAKARNECVRRIFCGVSLCTEAAPVGLNARYVAKITSGLPIAKAAAMEPIEGRPGAQKELLTAGAQCANFEAHPEAAVGIGK